MIRLVAIAIISVAVFFVFQGIAYRLTGSDNLAAWAALIVGFVGSPLFLLHAWPETESFSQSAPLRRAVNAFLRVIFVRRAPALEPANEVAVLNYALDLAQEWGEYWMQLIQTRLIKVYPKLEQKELDHLNAVAQDTMHFAHDLVYSMAEEQGRRNVSEAQWRTQVLGRYPWIDEDNLRHLYSTGRYYAMRELG